MLQAVLGAFRFIPDEANTHLVSTWAEEKRILPSALTFRPGAYRWNTTPYLKEIADCLSESSDVCEVAVMKGARIGFTVGVIENHLGYMIDKCPGGAMFLSANKEVAQTSVELRVDRMIESAGLAGKIFSQSTKKANKKQGDSKAKKEYPGGFLLVGGPSGAFLRSNGIRYLYCDEIDEWKLQIGAADKKKGVTANQGDPIELARCRTDEYEFTRKIVYGSTPLDDATSKIKELFEKGDKCYYFVPCKHCGHKQTLRWRDEGRALEDQFRLRFEKDSEGIVIESSVHYLCEKCGGKWINADKLTFLPAGEWRATAKPKAAHFRSFHISSLYSPYGAKSWTSICQDWVNAQGDVTKLRTFINTRLGETWKEKGEAPNPDKVSKRFRGYAPGTLPPEARALIVTVGADIHPDMIACEVVAWGKDKESWSIRYEEFEGKNTIDLGDEAWAKLREILDGKHAGLPVSAALVDSGFNSPTVYDFCEYLPEYIRPVKGEPGMKADAGTQRIYALRDRSAYSKKCVHLDTTHHKLEVYNFLNRGTAEGGAPTGPFPGYCHFPSGEKGSVYDVRYFRQLCAEDRVSKRQPNGRSYLEWMQRGRNEALDCRCYALGCLSVMYGEQYKELEEAAAKIDQPFKGYAWADFWAEVLALKGGLTYPLA